MEKEKKETENCAEKKMHAHFPARYFTSILHFLLCSLYLNLIKCLGAGIVGEYGGMEKEKKETENCVKKEMHADLRPHILPRLYTIFSVHYT